MPSDGANWEAHRRAWSLDAGLPRRGCGCHKGTVVACIEITTRNVWTFLNCGRWGSTESGWNTHEAQTLSMIASIKEKISSRRSRPHDRYMVTTGDGTGNG